MISLAEFDSSYKRGKPTTFAPNQVIKGWTEAMQLMAVGDKWEMYIPYELAYGASGRPPSIPACACLVFVMEIIKIKGATTPKAVVFPVWTAEEEALWLDKDEEACVKWKESKVHARPPPPPPPPPPAAAPREGARAARTPNGASWGAVGGGHQLPCELHRHPQRRCRHSC